MRNKLLYGEGIYDLELPKSYKVDGKTYFKEDCYLRWERMLHRCYGISTKNTRPTYNGCEVCDEWLVFSNFKAWIESWDGWQSKHLDKDLLVEGNRMYSPHACCMIESHINSLLTLRQNDRGPYPVGVTKVGENCRGLKKFVARINLETNVRKTLGNYHTPEEAHKAWQIAKKSHIKDLQSQQTDSRVIGGLQRIVDKLTHHIENNIETKDL